MQIAETRGEILRLVARLREAQRAGVRRRSLTYERPDAEMRSGSPTKGPTIATRNATPNRASE